MAASLTLLDCPLGAPSTGLLPLPLSHLFLLYSSWGPLLCLETLPVFSAKPTAHPSFQAVSSKITQCPPSSHTPWTPSVSPWLASCS